MNCNALHIGYNQLRSLLIFISFFTMVATAMAQSKENPKQLKKQLAATQDDRKKIDLWLSLSTYYLTKDGEVSADLDSALVASSKARILSKRIHFNAGIAKTLVLDAQIFREKGKSEVAFEKTSECIAFSKTHALNEQIGDGYVELSKQGGLREKIQNKEIAVSFFRKINAPQKLATTLKDAGELYTMSGDGGKGVQLLQESLSLYKTISFKALQGNYNLLCDANTQKGDYAEALKYGLLAEKTALALADTSLQLSSIYNHIGLVYFYISQDSEAENYWKKALKIACFYKNPGYIRTITANQVTLLVRQRNYNVAVNLQKGLMKKYPATDIETEMNENYMLFNMYMIMKKFADAEVYYQKLIAHYGENVENESDRTYLLRSFAAYHFYTKKFTDFYKNAREIEKITAIDGNNMLRSENYLMWFRVDSIQGNYGDAINHFQLYKKLSDLVFNGEKSKQINSLQVEFESEKKDKNIKFLTQQAKLREIKIHNDSIIRYVFIGSVIVLILFLALLYNRFRLKQRTNKKLESKQLQINEQNEQLKKLLTEKEWLLKEIHHRVKNNLQIVISLLNTQSAYLDNEDALAAIQNSQHRMHAMSLIHQKLYQSDNLAHIEISWYIYELVNYLKESFDKDRKISYTLDTEKVELDVAQAVPLGLILNEAVSNSIKYAFPKAANGTIAITLKNIGDARYQLVISDDGIGLPENFDITNSESLGMSLMMGLSDQLDGIFTIANDKGLKITVEFTLKKQLSDTTDSI